MKHNVKSLKALKFIKKTKKRLSSLKETASKNPQICFIVKKDKIDPYRTNTNNIGHK